jgi:hypothetical protein
LSITACMSAVLPSFRNMTKREVIERGAQGGRDMLLFNEREPPPSRVTRSPFSHLVHLLNVSASLD